MQSGFPAISARKDKVNPRPLMTLGPETGGTVAVSACCLCSDGSQVSTLDTRGPCWTESLDQGQHTKMAILNTHRNTHTGPDIQILLRHQQAHL